MANRKQLLPVEDLQSQAHARLNVNSKAMSPVQFRDALTRASGAIRGIPTEQMNWNRWGM